MMNGRFLGAINPMRITADGSHTVWLLGMLFLLPGAYLFLHGQYSLLITLMVLAVLLMTWIVDHTLSITLTFAFLIVVGDIRRVVLWAGGSVGLDPMLLVGAIMSIYLAAPLFMRLRVSDTLSKAILGLMALMFLEMFNPKQGPLAVGISGALYYIVPLLWFWIAREYATEKMVYVLIYWVFVPLGALGAIMGIYQTFVGFLPWQDAWNKAGGVQFTIGHYRAFGFSNSIPEFASLLLLANVGVMAAIWAKRRAFLLLLPILATASVLASSRGLLVKIVFASAIIWAVSGKGARAWLPRLTVALVVGFGLMIYSASNAENAQVERNDPSRKVSDISTADSATKHVTQGLANPLDSKSSTAGGHFNLLLLGIEQGFLYPIGIGIGGVTLGSGKFGTGGFSTEVDISDIFLSMGFVGGILYVSVMVMTVRKAFAYVRNGTPTLSLGFIGILAAMIGAWFAPGQYSVAPFVWFCIGTLVRIDRNSEKGRLVRSQEQAASRRLPAGRSPIGVPVLGGSWNRARSDSARP